MKESAPTNIAGAKSPDWHTDNADAHNSAVRSLRISKIFIPILLGLGVIIWLISRDFDFEKLQDIDWGYETFAWISLASALMVLRHLAFSLRMYILAQGHFTFRKCIELVLIFEFSLCVTPTTLGGSAVSLFVLTQERLSAARTTAIVLYKVVLDTFFFVGTFPILFLLNGANVIAPHIWNLATPHWESRLFFFSYFAMMSYGSVLFYGLFINPKLIRNLLVAATRLPFLTKLRARAEKLGDEIIVAAIEMKNIRLREHLFAFLATCAAWAFKFILIACIIYGIDAPELTIGRDVLLYGRLQVMFIIMAFSPTPGGAGFAEGLFYPFLKDFISNVEIATVIALIWRLMSYYLYLALGAIVIPNWIKKVYLANKETTT